MGQIPGGPVAPVTQLFHHRQPLRPRDAVCHVSLHGSGPALAIVAAPHRNIGCAAPVRFFVFRMRAQPLAEVVALAAVEAPLHVLQDVRPRAVVRRRLLRSPQRDGSCWPGHAAVRRGGSAARGPGAHLARFQLDRGLLRNVSQNLHRCAPRQPLGAFPAAPHEAGQGRAFRAGGAWRAAFQSNFHLASAAAACGGCKGGGGDNDSGGCCGSGGGGGGGGGRGGVSLSWYAEWRVNDSSAHLINCGWEELREALPGSAAHTRRARPPRPERVRSAAGSRARRRV